MSVLELPAEMPDVYGLPEYRVSEMAVEITGHDVRLAFGDRRFGQTQWLYTAVVDPATLLMIARRCEAIAQEAYNLAVIMGRRHTLAS
jgi:hypothetical protein